MPLRTEACFLVTIGSFSRYFDSCEGGEKSADFEKRPNGGAPGRQVVFGPTDWTDLVIGSDYDPERDDADIDQLDEWVGDGAHEESVTVQPCNDDFQPIGGSRSYTGHISKVTPPSYSKTSSTTATWSFTVVVTGRA